jgi:hypothetical protein
MRNALLISMLLLTASACVQKQKRMSKASRELAAQIVSHAAPTPQHALDIRFENKVQLLGYDLSVPQVREGQTFTVTWYWHVQEPLRAGWKLFTHLADAKRKNRVNLDAQRPLRDVYPEQGWKKGDYIKDVQEVTLPNGWRSPEAVFYVGFWNGPNRLRVTAGPHDAVNRAEALRVPVVGENPTPPLPRLIARRLSGPLKIDGKLDEQDWSDAQPSGAFVQTMTGGAGSFAAGVRVLYDDEHLYVGFEVKDDYLKSTFKQADDHLWEQDAVELMVDPDGDGENYFEIQVAPSGLVFDTRYDSRRQPQPFGEIGWNSGAAAKVALRGKLNDDTDDDGYGVELAIPWKAFAAGPTPASPPAAGASWRMNFFVLDARRDGQRAVGWSPPLVGDFHTLDRFGRVVFPQAAVAEPAGPPAPAAPVAPAR